MASHVLTLVEDMAGKAGSQQGACTEIANNNHIVGSYATVAASGLICPTKAVSVHQEVAAAGGGSVS